MVVEDLLRSAELVKSYGGLKPEPAGQNQENSLILRIRRVFTNCFGRVKLDVKVANEEKEYNLFQWRLQ
jgi:hypothetical protein